MKRFRGGLVFKAHPRGVLGGWAFSYERGTPVARLPGAVPGLFLLKREREIFIDNLLVRIHFIIVTIRWTGLAPWEFEFPFPGSLTSTFLVLLKILNPTASERRGNNLQGFQDF